MGWISKDFVCSDCGHMFDDIFDSREENLQVECPHCGSMNTEMLLSVPNVGAFSAASPERQREILAQRSAKHTAKEVLKEPERWGQTGIEEAKKYKNPQVGYTGK